MKIIIDAELGRGYDSEGTSVGISKSTPNSDYVTFEIGDVEFQVHRVELEKALAAL